jgi:hypothetical protein
MTDGSSGDSRIGRLVFENPDPKTGFMLMLDSKWDGKSIEELYCLAICHDRAIACLRDLGPQHLPLLRNIQDQGLRAIEEKYGVAPSRLRVYVHYPPQFYHFHGRPPTREAKRLACRWCGGLTRTRGLCCASALRPRARLVGLG